MNKKSGTFNSVRALTVSAMLTALSVVIGIFCKNFLNFGMGLFRVTFENLPILMSGILFGPLAGGLVGAASDLISYMLSSQVYPPNLIVTAGAVTVGVVSGLVSRLTRSKGQNARIIISCSLAHLAGSMIIKPIGLYQFYGILVLWRIPLYLVIAPLEILLICLLFRKESIKKLFTQVGGEIK